MEKLWKAATPSGPDGFCFCLCLQYLWSSETQPLPRLSDCFSLQMKIFVLTLQAHPGFGSSWSFCIMIHDPLFAVSSYFPLCAVQWGRNVESISQSSETHWRNRSNRNCTRWGRQITLRNWSQSTQSLLESYKCHENWSTPTMSHVPL